MIGSGLQSFFVPPVGSWYASTGYRTTFTDRDGVEPTSLHSSNKIKLPESVAAGSTVTFPAGTIRLNNGSFGTSVTAGAGDIIQIQLTASASYETAVSDTVQDDGVDITGLDWTVTTRAEEATNDEFPYELPFTLG